MASGERLDRALRAPDALPNELNPAEGFIVTANQAVTGPGYRFYLTDSPDLGYRSQRIRNLLTSWIDAGPKLDVSDMTRMQLDDRNPMAPVLLPYLMRQLMTSEYYADGQRLLLDWDFTQPADSAAAAYFNVVWSNVLARTFQDQLPEQLWPDGGDRWMAVVSNLLRQPDSQWWDDAETEGVVEDRDMILSEAMRDARDELTRKVAVESQPVDLGPAAPPRPGEPGTGAQRDRCSSRPSSTAVRSRWAVAARAWTRPAGTRARLRPSRLRPRCGWWSTSTTSSGPAG